MLDFDLFTLEVKNGVGIVTIDRPPVNALRRESYESLGRLLEHIESTDEVRAVVLKAKPDARAFVGGADLNEFLTLNYETRIARHAVVTEVMDRFYNLSRPTIAAITSPAPGGGMVVASLCDLRIAADHVFFAMPEIDRGLTGGAGSYYNRLNMPVSIIREMIFTGRRFTAAEMYRVGFLNYVLPKEEVVAKAIEIGEVIAKKSLPALQAIKSCANLIDSKGWEEGRHAGNHRSAQLTDSADYREGIQAFLQKREPEYRDA